jgi:pimeloyl-ACP methyl ester carboxylesterase
MAPWYMGGLTGQWFVSVRTNAIWPDNGKAGLCHEDHFGCAKSQSSFSTFPCEVAMPISKGSAVSHFHEATVRGAPFRYVDLGRGAPVVFVHGMVCDHRVWNAQLKALATSVRCIAYDQRYFGIDDWPQEGPRYSVETHTDDLACFLEEVVQRPAHIVGHSYGGGVALALAVAKPDWVQSLCLYEPAGLPATISDSEHLATIDAERSEIAPVVDTIAQGQQVAAVKQAVDWIEGISGSFNSLPSVVQQVIRENAHTLAQHLSAPPSKVTCADLHAISAPVTLLRGADTRPYFAIFANAIGQCLVNAEAVVLPGVRHFAPFQDADLLARQVSSHLQRCGVAATL